MSFTPKVLKSVDAKLEAFRWLTLKKLTYVDKEGRQRFWESAERTTRHGAVDAVAIVAITSDSKILLVSQYRPPLDSTCLELPAGLIDKGESPEIAALRELREETGFGCNNSTDRAASIVDTSPIIHSDPGMSSANMQTVVVKLSESSTDTLPTQQLEDGEHIDIHFLDVKNLEEELCLLQKKTNWCIDARLFMLAQGLKLSQILI
jgi:ADP-ribose pyrophosphatase